jgi:hypothetical protein
MSRKLSLIMMVMGALLLVSGFVFLSQSPAQAQCGDNPPKSSCITCHEKEDPVYQNGEWHGIHALKDCCMSCHGGNCSAQDKDLAHESLVANPLADIYIDCRGCHPADYNERANRFAAILDVSPGSSPTATPVPVATVEEHEIVILPTLSSSTPSFQPWILVLGAAGVSILFLLGLFELAKHLPAQR